MSVDYDRLRELLNECTTGQWQFHDYEPDPYCYPGATRFLIAADWDRVEIAESQAGPSTKFSEYARKASDFALMALAPELARELLRLRDGVQDIRGTCHLAYKFTTQVDTPEHKAVGENLKEVVSLLDHLLDGDTE